MADPFKSDPPLWVGERDRDGQPIQPAVREAAARIWRRVLYYVRRYRYDVAEAAEILEEAVFAVSRRVSRGEKLGPVRGIDSYLFTSFVHAFWRRVERDGRMEYFDDPDALDTIDLSSPADAVEELDNQILLEQLIAAMKPRVRQMFAMRCAGHSWEEVGRQFDINKHNAEVQFAYGLRKAKEQLGLQDERPKGGGRKK